MHGQLRRDDVTNIRPDLAVLRMLMGSAANIRSWPSRTALVRYWSLFEGTRYEVFRHRPGASGPGGRAAAAQSGLGRDAPAPDHHHRGDPAFLGRAGRPGSPAAMSRSPSSLVKGNRQAIVTSRLLTVKSVDYQGRAKLSLPSTRSACFMAS